MIPHFNRKKNPYNVRMANKHINRILAKVKRVAKRRAKKGYGCDLNALIKREAYK